MTIAAEYVHALEGRIRIKVPEIKGSPAKAGELERQVQWQTGISSIKANPTTGSVLIYYDSQQTEQQEIIKNMHSLGYLQPLTAQAFKAPEAPAAEQNSLMNVIVSSVAQSMMEMALTRLVTAII